MKNLSNFLTRSPKATPHWHIPQQTGSSQGTPFCGTNSIGDCLHRDVVRVHHVRWCDTSLIQYDIICYSMIWCDVIWCVVIRYDMIWYEIWFMNDVKIVNYCGAPRAWHASGLRVQNSRKRSPPGHRRPCASSSKCFWTEITADKSSQDVTSPTATFQHV